MREYQTVIMKLQGQTRDDEESLTDLLNERARAGWSYDSIEHLSPGRVLLVFSRET